MNIPQEIYIGPHKVPYRIKLVDRPRAKFLGKCSYKKQTIWLNTNQTVDALMSCYIHEVLHAMEFESGGRIKHEIIYRFESELYWFIKNNFKETK